MPISIRAAALPWFVLALAPAFAAAAPMSFDLTLAGDEAGGRSLDAAFSISPTRHLTLDAAAGHSRGAEETGGLEGTLAALGASVHGERAGFALRYDRFDDSSNYESATLGGRAWMSFGDVEVALLGRRRDLAVQVTLALPLRTVTREVEFGAVGAGVQVGFAREGFSAYVLALAYDYDEDLDRFLEIAASPQLERRPRIEALVGSFLTQAQGAVDRQLGAGVEWGAGRHSFAVDVSSVHDALLDARSTSLVFTWRRAETARVDWGLSAGVVDSDTWGRTLFASAMFGIAN